MTPEMRTYLKAYGTEGLTRLAARTITSDTNQEVAEELENGFNLLEAALNAEWKQEIKNLNGGSEK